MYWTTGYILVSEQNTWNMQWENLYTNGNHLDDADSQMVDFNCELVHQKQVWRVGTPNYIAQYSRDVITCPCPSYQLLAHKSSIHHEPLP